MTEGSEEFIDALDQIRAAYIDSLEHFTKWLQKNWLHEKKENWPNDDPWPGDDFAKGFDKAIETLDMALELYTEEFRKF